MEPTLKDGDILINGQKEQNPELTKPAETSAVFSLSLETVTKNFRKVALCYWRQLTLSNGRNSYEIKAWLRAQQIHNEKRMADCSDQLLRYARCDKRMGGNRCRRLQVGEGEQTN